MEEIRLPPFTAARNLRTALPDAGAVETAPGVARRRRVLNGGAAPEPGGWPDEPPAEGLHGVLEESILALRRLPGVVLQWMWKPGGDGGDSRRLHLAVDWRLPTGVVPELPADGSGALVLLLPDEDATIRVHAQGPAVRWQDGSGGRAHRTGLTTELDPHVPLTLLFVLESGKGMGASATLRRLGDLEGELEARASDDRRASDTELDLHVEASGPSEVSDAFRWARRRLHGALIHPGGRRPGVLRSGSSDREDRPTMASDAELARVGTGLLALGRHEDVAELLDGVLERLGDGPESRGGRPGEPSHGGIAGLLELLGRHSLWTGDASALHRLGEGLETWVEALVSVSRRPPGRAGRRGALRAALSVCAEAVEAAGDRQRADDLRTLRDEEIPNGSGSGVVSLEGGSVEWLRRLEERLRTDGAGSPDLSGLAETGRLVSWLLYELLGARADGFYGRLRLAPRIPRQWHRFAVGGIRMADARARLCYHEEGGRHTFRLEPTGGRVPVNLVFEPLLPASVLHRASVDGEAADLDRYRRDGRVGVRLQLPLDGIREVVLEEGRR